ncbi:MAG: cbb3-type cytochrome oxidase assembly protein CcoS [Gammaproteobacteria bacterium]
MDIVYLLIAVSMLVVVAIVAVFLWAIQSGQFDDLDDPGQRLIADEDDPRADPRPRDP